MEDVEVMFEGGSRVAEGEQLAAGAMTTAIAVTSDIEVIVDFGSLGHGCS